MSSDPFTIIRDTLYTNPYGLKISDISELTGLNRNTVSKYADMLSMSGQAIVRRKGMAKIFLPIRKNRHQFDHISALFKVIIIDHSRVIVYANEAFINFCGLERDKVLGKQYQHLHLPLLELPGVEFGIRDAFKGIDVQKKVVHDSSETPHTYNLRITSFDLSKAGSYFIIFFEDITHDTEPCHTNTIQDRIYRQFYNESPDGYVCTLPDGAVVSCNPAFLKILGYPPDMKCEEFSIYDTYPNPELRSSLLDQLKHDTPVLNYQNIRKKCDGTCVPTKEDIIGIYDNGVLIEIHSYFHEDLTRKIPPIEQSLLHIDAAEFNSFVWDIPLETLTCQPSVLKSIGWNHPTGIIPLHQWIDRIHPDDLKSMINAIEKHFSGAAPHAQFLYRFMNDMGKWVLILDIIKTTKYDCDGNPASAASFFFVVAPTWNQGLEPGAGTRGWNQGLEPGAGTRGWNQGLEPGAGTRGCITGIEESEILQNSGSWTWLADTDTIYWSPGLYRILDIEPYSTAPSPELFMIRVHSDDRKGVQSHVERVMLNKEPYISFEHRILKLNGTVQTVIQRACLFVKNDGSPDRIMGTIQVKEVSSLSS